MTQTFVSSFNLFASLMPARNAAIFILGAIFVVACIVVAIVAEWKIFVKAGRPGWAALIPVYSSWVLFEVCGKPGWWALVGLVPYVGWLILMVFYVIAMLELAKRFGQTTMFAVLGLIVFQVVGFIILGFGDATYNDHPNDEHSFQSPSSE